MCIIEINTNIIQMKNSVLKHFFDRHLFVSLTAFLTLILIGCTKDELTDTNFENNAVVAKVLGDCANIALKGNNGKYVSSEDGIQPMNCNRSQLGAWEKFTLVSVGNGQYALKGNNGKYISSENGNKPITCNRPQVGAWEKFTIQNVGNGKYALKGNNGKYISSENGNKPMTCNRTNPLSWETFEVIELCGGNPDPGPGPGQGANTPYDLLGLQNWKLNGLSGTKSNNQYVDAIPNLSSYTNSDWFFVNNNWAIFQVWAGSDTSSGSGNPRMELRELTANGNSNIFWDGTTSKEHRMRWKVRVDRLPSSGKVCFGQIHDKTDFFDDVIRVQCQGSANQTSGSVKLRINGYVTEALEGGGKTVGNFNLGEELYFELTYQNSVVKLYELNNNGGRVRTIFTSQRAAAKQNYFKAGSYLQSMKGKSYKSSDYGSVAIQKLEVFH